jgi:peptidoglycan/LPS O-acetylase OafA/YrhL
MHTDMRLDALLVPAALAILLRSTAFRDRLIRWLFLWPLLLPLLLVPVTFNLIPRTTGVLIAWLMPFLVLGTMLRPHSWFGRLLEAAPLRYIGRLSYSLYLWQQLFFIAHYDRDAGRLGLLQQWPLALVMTFACALLSYYCVERPFIRLGHRLAPNVAANRIRR